MARTLSDDETSSGATIARPPAASISRATRRNAPSRRAAKATTTPSRANAFAVASPMPLEAPVINTTWSRNLCLAIICSSVGCNYTYMRKKDHRHASAA
ncbi:Uncharacterised protein [Mycobacterium tuberculosis]|nr:Uncharacterised protein [Mycobacterium tuberculosis]